MLRWHLFHNLTKYSIQMALNLINRCELVTANITVTVEGLLDFQIHANDHSFQTGQVVGGVLE